MDSPTEIGLFPLNLVLVPGEQAPLHVFEPRYRELISECLDFGNDFGLLLEDDEGMREVGTRCKVVEVIDRFPDGRLNVVVEATERFQLLEVTDGRTFRTAELYAGLMTLGIFGFLINQALLLAERRLMRWKAA